jgi:hypothetical protein
MDNVLLMEVIDGLEGFTHYVADYRLREFDIKFPFKQVSQTACVHIFEEYPKSLSEIVPLIILAYVAVVADGH